MSDKSSDNESSNDQDELQAQSITKEIDDLIAEKNSDYSGNENSDHPSDSDDESSNFEGDENDDDDIDGYFSEELDIRPASRPRVKFPPQKKQSLRDESSSEYESSDQHINEAGASNSFSEYSYDEDSYELSQEDEPGYNTNRTWKNHNQSSASEDEHQAEQNDADSGEEINDISRKMKELFTSDEESSEYNSDDDIEDDRADNSDSHSDPEYTNKKKKKPPTQTSSLINEDGRVFLSLAQKEYAAGNLQDAVLLIEEAILEDPRSRLPYILLDVIHTDQGNPEAALNAKILAATAASIFPDDWEDVATRSMELGLYSQAITFFQRAISLNPNEPSYRLHLAEAYKVIGNKRRAISTMKRLHIRYPSNPTYTSELAKLYLDSNLVQSAVTLYEDILIANMEQSTLDLTKVQPFGWSELNVLCELYDKQEVWAKGIRTIKRVARWLLDRSDEVWWTEIKDDSEFDSRRSKTRGFNKSRFRNDESKFILPLDIRCKLLLFRLEMHDDDEALVHAQFLLEADRDTYPDLLWEAGTRFMKFHKYDTALRFFFMLIDDNTDIPSELLIAISKCEMELDKWENARQHLEMIIESDPNNVEAFVNIAEVCYTLDDVKAAKGYVVELQKLLRNQKINKNSTESQEQPLLSASDSSALIKQVIRPRKSNRTLGPRERRELKKKLESEAVQMYNELQYYWESILKDGNNMSAIIHWQQIAYQLIGQVLSVRAFTLGKKVRLNLHIEEKDDQDMEQRLNLLTNKLIQNDLENDENGDSDDENMEDEPKEEEDDGMAIKIKVEDEDTQTSKFKPYHNVKFRGLTIPQWFSIFMQLAIFLSIYNEDPSESFKILDAARGIKVLREEGRLQTLNIVHLACTYHAEIPKSTVELIRYFSLGLVYCNDVYRLHHAVLGVGQKGYDIFKSHPVQKYYFRRIKLLESQHKSMGKPMSPIPYFLIGCIYIAYRSYAVALDYLYKALDLAPENPLLLLVVGMSHILRSLNRLSTNRHIQILQGFFYMKKYLNIRKQDGVQYITDLKERRTIAEETGTSQHKLPTVDNANWEEQEACYNIGRSFHALGLHTEALLWYEKALNDYPDVVPDEDSLKDQHEEIKAEVNSEAAAFTLKPNTAYNLINLYSMSGNLKLARDITDKYLVI